MNERMLTVIMITQLLLFITDYFIPSSCFLSHRIRSEKGELGVIESRFLWKDKEAQFLFSRYFTVVPSVLTPRCTAEL